MIPCYDKALWKRAMFAEEDGELSWNLLSSGCLGDA